MSHELSRDILYFFINFVYVVGSTRQHLNFKVSKETRKKYAPLSITQIKMLENVNFKKNLRR